MPTLTAGQTVSIQLAEGEGYTITPSGVAQVSTKGVSGGPLSSGATFSDSRTFGPYTEAGVLNIACTAGSVTYTAVASSVYYDTSTGFLYAGGSTVTGPAYTWANRPTAAGNTGLCVRITDVGVSGGSYWFSDGTNWRPVGGSVLIASQQGSITTPVSAFTGVTSSTFTITQPVFPAGMLIPGSATIEVEAQLRRTGATATALMNVRLGTAKTSADNAIYAFTYAATTLLDLFVNPSVLVAETSRVVATNWQTRGGSGNASVYQERTGNINTAAEMGITFDISSANAADSFALIGYKVRLFQ